MSEKQNNNNNNICDEYIELISQYLDGELNNKQSQQLENHLQKCSVCAERLKQYSQIGQIINADQHKCPQDIASIVLADAERKNLLSGFELLAKPAVPLWVKFVKIISAAAMITVAIGVLLIAIRVPSFKSSRSEKIINLDKQHLTKKYKQYDISNQCKYNVSNKGVPKVAEKLITRKIAKAKEEENLIGKRALPLAIRPTSTLIAGRNVIKHTLANIMPFKITIYADIPMLMLIKEQLTELLELNNIHHIDLFEISSALQNQKYWYYSAKQYELSSAAHFAEILVFADITKINAIYNQLISYQFENTKIEITKKLQNILRSLQKSKTSAEIKMPINVKKMINTTIKRIYSYFSQQLSAIHQSTTTNVTTKVNKTLIPVLIILQQAQSKPARLTPATKITTAQSTQSTQSIQSTQSTKPIINTQGEHENE